MPDLATLGEFFSSTPDAIFVLGRGAGGALVFEAVNPACERLGLSSERVRGREPHDCLSSTEGQDLEARCGCCMRSGEPLAYEAHGLLRPESTFELQLVPLRDRDGRVESVAGIARDVTGERQDALLHQLQLRLMDSVARAVTLPEMLEAIVCSIEEVSPRMRGSILLLEGDRLRPGAAPHLPEGYTRIIDGLSIGPAVGSCGTAAFLRRRVVVSDISTDPLWAPFKELPLGFGLRACWSEPIFSQRGRVLGTFAMYDGEAREPTALELRVIEAAASHAALAIERHRLLAELREREILLRLSIDAGHVGTWQWDLATDSLHLSAPAERLLGLADGVFVGTREALCHLLPAEERPRFDEALAAATGAEHKSFRLQHRVSLRDGSLRRVEWEGEVFRDSTGQPARMAGVVRESVQAL